MTVRTPLNPKHRSREITEGPQRAPARAMLRAVGLDDAALGRPFIGIANLASNVTPCNVHLDRLARKVKEGVLAGQGTPFDFGTITPAPTLSWRPPPMQVPVSIRPDRGGSRHDVSALPVADPRGRALL